jgi:hypothetical protein
MRKGKTFRARSAARGKSASTKTQSSRIPRAVKRTDIESRSKRSSGSWDTQKWLIGKKLAHVVKEKLIADYRGSGEAGAKVPSKASKDTNTRLRGRAGKNKRASRK